jgi:5-methylcytosine-specific restriction endonuclease McrA
MRSAIMKEQNGLCCWCGEPMQQDRPRAPDYATFEHLIRRRNEGKCGRHNLALAHMRCNQNRG